MVAGAGVIERDERATVAESVERGPESAGVRRHGVLVELEDDPLNVGPAKELGNRTVEEVARADVEREQQAGGDAEPLIEGAAKDERLELAGELECLRGGEDRA